jgi:hypothetical protein
MVHHFLVIAVTHRYNVSVIRSQVAICIARATVGLIVDQLQSLQQVSAPLGLVVDGILVLHSGNSIVYLLIHVFVLPSDRQLLGYVEVRQAGKQTILKVDLLREEENVLFSV